MNTRFTFSRDPALDALGIPVSFVLVHGLERRVPPAVSGAVAAAFVRDLLAASSYETLAADAALAGYRDLHARIGKMGRQYLPSPESLFKQIFRRGSWRPIDPLVDAYSLVALKTRVSIGAHDLAKLRLPVRLACTTGDESFVPIGESAAVPLGAGEYAYRDADGQILGRMEIRQAASTCVGPDTSDVLFIVQGHRTLGSEVLRATIAELLDTLQRLVGPYANSRITALD